MVFVFYLDDPRSFSKEPHITLLTFSIVQNGGLVIYRIRRGEMLLVSNNGVFYRNKILNVSTILLFYLEELNFLLSDFIEDFP